MESHVQTHSGKKAILCFDCSILAKKNHIYAKVLTYSKY